jgi:hypothetical protein
MKAAAFRRVGLGYAIATLAYNRLLAVQYIGPRTP